MDQTRSPQQDAPLHSDSWPYLRTNLCAHQPTRGRRKHPNQRVRGGGSLRSPLPSLTMVAVLATSFVTLALQMTIVSNYKLFAQAQNPPRQFPVALSWPSMRLHGPIDNFFYSHKEDRLFFAVNGDIFSFKAENFEPQSSSATGSNNNGRNTTIQTSQSSHITKALAVVRFNKRDYLFACWQVNSFSIIKCALHKLEELSKSALLEWPKNIKGFRIDDLNGGRIHVLSSRDEANSILLATSKSIPPLQSYVADNSSLSLNVLPTLPAVARFELDDEKSSRTITLKPRSVLPYAASQAGLDLYYDYLQPFDYGDYTHFVVNDIRKPSPSAGIKEQITPLIARICANDTNLSSYTELTLGCNGLNNLYARYTHLDAPGPGSETLYVAFERQESTPIKKQAAGGSIVCSYSMGLVEDVFNRVVSDCNGGSLDSKLLVKAHPQASTDSTPMCQINPSKDWCTSQTNPYIDGTSDIHKLRGTHMSLENVFKINFIQARVQGRDDHAKGVLFLGTELGHLIKVGLDDEIHFDLNLNTNSVSYKWPVSQRSGDQPTTESNNTHSFRYSSVSNKIVAINMVTGLISQLDMDSCAYYTSCHACLNARDPLGCEWCNGSCSRSDQCPYNDQPAVSCPPIIRGFSPKSGPITGSTWLKVEGENFGTRNGKLSIKISQFECEINRESITNEAVECVVPTVNEPLNATIDLEVHDESTPIYSVGSVSSTEEFIYQAVEVFGMSPRSGSTAGGTRVNIHGTGLASGRNRSVFLGPSECSILELEADHIACKTSALLQSANSSVLPLRYMIDGHQQLVALQANYRGLSLSNTFTYLAGETTPNDSQITDDGAITVRDNDDLGGHSLNTYVIILVLILVFLTLTYLILAERLPDCLKLPKFTTTKDSKTSENLRVSFKNGQRPRLHDAGDANDGNSALGLVKLSGSVMTSSEYFLRPEHQEQDKPLINSFLDSEMMTLLAQEKILIDRSRLTLGHVLGSGQFGRVYKGFLKNDVNGEHIAVAVKTLHSRRSWDDDIDSRAFVDEGLMMKDFQHENVLALIGVTFDSSGLPMVITPFMLYGDLRSYISDEAASPTVRELIDFGIQVARGMAYLAGLKFVHRDLAARNCMLDDNLVVKVADFGLSRDIYERDYYSSDNKTKLPVKWMAIESLEKCIYNTKTDVWSYGVLLWELMTRGVVPYPDVDNFDLFTYLKEGRRMMKPRYCPMLIFKIMLSCWDEDPSKRPAFSELVTLLSDVIVQLQTAKDGQQRVDRDTDTYCDVDFQKSQHPPGNT